MCRYLDTNLRPGPRPAAAGTWSWCCDPCPPRTQTRGARHRPNLDIAIVYYKYRERFCIFNVVL